MTNLGYGIFDRRTILAILIILVLSNVLLGGSIPINTTNAFTLLNSLVFFTAYLYGTRTLFRLIMAFILIKIMGRVTELEVDMLLTSGDLWKDSFFGIIDRIVLIVITLIATWSTIGVTLVGIGGIGGLIIMLTIFLIRGHFGLVVEDATQSNNS